jgi:hypothetical protein
MAALLLVLSLIALDGFADRQSRRRRGQSPHCDVRLLALSGHRRAANQCPLSGVKQTSRFDCAMSAFDPKRTSVILPLIAPFLSLEPLGLVRNRDNRQRDFVANGGTAKSGISLRYMNKGYMAYSGSVYFISDIALCFFPARGRMDPNWTNGVET